MIGNIWMRFELWIIGEINHDDASFDIIVVFWDTNVGRSRNVDGICVTIGIDRWTR